MIEEDARLSDAERVRSHMAYMRAHYIVETRRWDGKVAAPDLEGLSLRPAATVLFTDGMAALHRGEIDLAEAQLEALRSRRHDLLAEATEGHCASGYVRTGGERTIEAMIMELELEGLIALTRGETEAGLDKLREAVVLEEDTPFGFGPPVPPKPAQEILGEALLALGRHQEARGPLETALDRAPRRAHALAALNTAPKESGDPALAAQTLKTLQQINHRADTEIAQALGAIPSR
jgi:tetratricopeptide (TPR) repeat protein